jgi:hypothetical protein
MTTHFLEEVINIITGVGMMYTKMRRLRGGGNIFCALQMHVMRYESTLLQIAPK